MTGHVQVRQTDYLQVIEAVQSLLKGRSVDGDYLYEISALISDLPPEQALHAIAFSARALVKPYLGASPTLAAMDVECDRMVGELLNWDASDLQSLEVLECLQEEFEYLEELADLAGNYFAAKDALAVSLCRVLKAQAKAQGVILDTVQACIVAKGRNECDGRLAQVLAFTPVHSG